MLTKPTNWDTLWGADGTRCDYQIIIGDDIYTGEDDIENDSLKINKPVFSANKPIGNTPCFTMECCLRQKESSITKGALLELQMRLINKTQYTSWVSLGQFKIYSRVEYEDGWVKLSCRDKMQMANQSYITDEVVEDDAWPKPMKTIMEDSVGRIGLTLDPNTVIQEGDAWVVPTPIGLSIRAVWSYIAAAHGGNFIITPNQTLLLVTPKATPDTDSQIPVELSSNGYELLGDVARVDQVTLTVNQLGIAYGDSGDNDISIECLYASSDAAIYAKTQLTGDLYYPVKVSDMLFDPLAEVQDTYSIEGLPVVWSDLTITCGIVPLADGKAEAMSEQANEYGFEDTPLNSLRTQMSDVDQKVDAAVDGALSKLDQETVFNALTDNGTAQGIFIQDGQIYINAAYLAAGTMAADLIKTGILQSADGSFVLNLDTGEFTISGMASKSDLDTLKQDGVDRIVTPVMKYSMSDDGLHIQKPGEEIGNSVDHEGMVVKRSQETMLRADKDGVIATDVTVRNFLHLGENTRFEDYDNGTDSNRTACFII